MNYLQLKLENKKLREENEKQKQTIQILNNIIKIEDDCVNQLLSSTIEDAKMRAGKYVFQQMKGKNIMLDILLTVLFISLFFWTIKLIFILTWGIAKVIAVILMIIALPTLIGGLMLAGGLILLIPIALIIGAIGIVKFLS